MCNFASMFEHCRKYVKLLIPILLGVFFVAFVINAYCGEPRKMKSVYTECISEMVADESECEEDELVEIEGEKLYSLEINGIVCAFFYPIQLSSLKLSEKKFRGLVRRYAPRPNSTYNQLFKNGTDLFQVCAIFYFENQTIKLWNLQVV